MSALDVNPHIRGCIATGGTDKVVKIWNVADDQDTGKRQVSLVTSRDLGVVRLFPSLVTLLAAIFACLLYAVADYSIRGMQGKVFSTAWSPDDPLTLAAAGSKAKLQVWDIGANAGARKVLGPKLAEAGRVLKERQSGGVIGVASDEEDSSGDEEGDEE